MKKIRIYVSIGLVGCLRETVIDVENDMKDDEIDELAKEEMFNLIEWGWKTE